MSSREDNIPLVAVKPTQQFCRTTSCFGGEPHENALNFLLNNDTEKLSNILSEICPEADDPFTSKSYNPLSEDHWINQPYGIEVGFKTLLHLAVEKKPDNLALNFTRYLLTAGARSDLYNESLGTTPIHVAAQSGNLETIKLLLEFSTKSSSIPNLLSLVDVNGCTPLHVAAQNNDLNLLKYILTRPELETIDGEDLTGRRTPLYIAAFNGHRDAVELLIKYGADTGSFINQRTIEDLIREKLPHLDINKIQVIQKPRRNSVADVGYALNKILDKCQMNLFKNLSNAQNYLHFTTLIRRMNKKELNTYTDGNQTLLQKCCAFGLAEFVKCLLNNGADPNATCSTESSPPLLLAVYEGHSEVLREMIEHKQNSTDSVNTVNFAVTERSGETVLHYILRKSKRESEDDKNLADDAYEQCFQVLTSARDKNIVQEIKRIINRKDNRANTPLHYATQLWSQETVLKLLELGANIGIQNNFDEIPISKILPATMENFLNDFCLQSDKPVTHSNFEVTFNYSFLAPPVESKLYDENDEEGQKLIERAALPETESLWYMSMSKPHRHLLKHPVITSFLHLKWRRIYGYFNRNLRFYLMFVLCSTWYIFERYGGMSLKLSPPKNNSESNATDVDSFFCKEPIMNTDEERRGFWYIIFAIHCALQFAFMITDWRREIDASNNMKASGRCGCLFNLMFASWLETVTLGLMVVVLIFSTGSLWYVITVLIVLLILRETFQMSVSLKRYCCTPENWLEICVISLMAFILWLPDDQLEDPCSVKRHLAAITLVLSWAELVTFVARHPRLARYNMYVIMFYKVLKTFFFFLIWYLFFIVAFGLGFYIMLHTDTTSEPKEEPSEYPFFDGPFLSLVKTTTMFVGEIEFSDLPMDLKSGMVPVSYLFLLAFVFLIIVVLMNLLNGLAVSDTGIIREKAEIVSYISRVDTISYLESLLLGDPFDFLSNWPPMQWLRSVPSLSLCRCLCQRNESMKQLTHKLTGATGILIFYSILPFKTLTIYPNAYTKSCFSSRRLSYIDLPREIIDSAKSLVIGKAESARLKEATDGADQKIEAILNQVRSLEQKLELVLASLKIKH